MHHQRFVKGDPELSEDDLKDSLPRSLESCPMERTRNPCLRRRCIKCCLNTQMPLSDSDVARIKGLGVSENLFVVERKGLQKLRNSMGRCVFHNGQACTIYGDRPEGCRIYPVLFDRDTKEVILDRDCSHKEEFRVAPGISHEIIRLVRRLDAERNSRLKSKGS